MTTLHRERLSKLLDQVPPQKRRAVAKILGISSDMVDRGAVWGGVKEDIARLLGDCRAHTFKAYQFKQELTQSQFDEKLKSFVESSRTFFRTRHRTRPIEELFEGPVNPYKIRNAVRTRITNLLSGIGIVVLGDLEKYSEADLLDTPGIDKVTVDEIKAAMSRFYLSLKSS